MTTSSIPTASEIPQHLKNTIISVLNNRGASDAAVAAASVGVAIVQLSKTHPDLVINEAYPFAETTSWLDHRNEITNLILQNFDQYTQVVRDVYQEYAQERVENFVQDLAESLFGSDVEIESIVVVNGNNLTGEAPVAAPATEERNPETCELCRTTPSATDKALAYPVATSGAQEAQATTGTPGAVLDVEAQADNVVPPYVRTGCGENN